MTDLNPEITAQIRTLNDKFRTTFDPQLGKIQLTIGLHKLTSEQLQQLLQAVRNFNNFSEEIDPYQEHDMGRIELFQESFYFKIDYLDRERWQDSFGSEDPANEQKTLRIMTIMLTDEY
ncbi:MAG: DUF3768 domain-containing protein [Symploca sp. SIO2E9]|nr:DUF3768 domain-containing protein [Symploca sp. SIO2E9]